MPITLASRQEVWNKRSLTAVAASSTPLSDPSSYGYGAISGLSDDPAAGRYYFVLPGLDSLPRCNPSLQLAFYAKRTGAAYPRVLARLWVLSDSGSNFYGRHLLDVEAACGDTQGTANPFPTGHSFCAALRWQVDKSLTPPGVRSVGAAPWPEGSTATGGRGWASLIIDNIGSRRIVLEARVSGGLTGDEVGVCTKTV